MKPMEYPLDAIARRQVLALAAEQAELAQALQENRAALMDLARRYAVDQGWEPAQATAHFDQRGDRLYLVITPTESEEPAGEEIDA